MGSFTDVSLSFDFAESAPDFVLAAFSALAAPGASVAGRTLPPSVPVTDPYQWEPEWHLHETGAYREEPWRQPWFVWVSKSMGVETTPHAILVPDETGKRWHLDCRFSWKTGPDYASDVLAWLGPFIDTGWRDRVLVGRAVYGSARPFLFWASGDRWETEDLNPDDDWRW